MMNMIEFAKSQGAEAVTLKLERQAIYASKDVPANRETTVKAYRLQRGSVTTYFWRSVTGRREAGSDFITTPRARFKVLAEN
jgi:hypothetical protein